jgi:hypothetical protein
MTEALRFYAVNNMYLSSIQQGIQPGHALGEMFVKYRRQGPKTAKDLLWSWAEKHKTWIVLNGGYQSELQKFADFLKSKKNPFPWACFHEEEDALNGALTSVCVVLPERVYNLRKFESYEIPLLRSHAEMLKKVTPWERELAEQLSFYPLAH